MAFVVDASIALAWLLPDEENAALDEVLSNASQDPLVVTGLWFYEVANALAIATRRKRLTRNAADEALDLISSVPITVRQLGWFEMRSAYRLGIEYGLSVYDASYLWLAKQHDLPLLTLDQPLRKAADKLGIR